MTQIEQLQLREAPCSGDMEADMEAEDKRFRISSLILILAGIAAVLGKHAFI